MLHFMLSLALLAAGGGDGDKADFEIVLKATATTRGTQVLLCDLVDVQPAGKDAFAIGQLVFAPAPVPGYARVVTRTEVLQALVLAGQPADRFAFKGPREVVVQSVTTEIPAQDLIDAGAAVMRAAIDQDGGDIDCELLTRVQHVPAPPGRRSLELMPRVRRDLSRTAATVEVDVMIDGVKWKTLQLQYQLTHYAPVVKAASAIRAGTALGPHNLEVVREKQMSATDFMAHKLEDVSGMVAKRDLRAGQAVAMLDFAPPALIHRGELVAVVLTRGNVKVTIKALAVNDAPQGGLVTVINQTSNTRLQGVAAAPGLVVIQN
jgi:flagellar basal body P-ring formation protein FlgA